MFFYSNSIAFKFMIGLTLCLPTLTSQKQPHTLDTLLTQIILNQHFREKEVKFVHLLGKDARSKIIAVLASTRSYNELADLLGVSTAAISKYLKGRTHPSDTVMIRAIELADYDEKEMIADIIINELGDGLREFISWAKEESLLKKRHLRKLEEILYEAYVSSPAKHSVP